MIRYTVISLALYVAALLPASAMAKSSSPAVSGESTVFLQCADDDEACYLEDPTGAVKAISASNKDLTAEPAVTKLLPPDTTMLKSRLPDDINPFPP
jgi:hypothetical protein